MILRLVSFDRLNIEFCIAKKSNTSGCKKRGSLPVTEIH